MVHQTATAQNGTASNVTGPFEMVLGESLNIGWQATLSNGSRHVDLGTSELVDGFANGWHVSAATLATLGVKEGQPAALTWSLNWKPQHYMTAGFTISIVAVLFCLVVLLRRRGRQSRFADLEEVPSFSWPFAGAGPRLGLLPASLTTIFVAAASSFLGGIKIGLATTLLTVVTLLLPRVRSLMTIVAAGAMAAAALRVTQLEGSNHVGFWGWTEHFAQESRLVLLASLLLGAEAIIEVVALSLRRRSMRTRGTTAVGEESLA